MASDRLFVVDAQKAAEIQAQFADVYFYKFSLRPPVSFSNYLTKNNNDYGMFT